MMALWKQRHTLEPGAVAPDFQLQALDGAVCSLTEILARGPALLAFFKVSCPICQYTLPFLERIHEAAGKGTAPLQIVGISQDEAASTREFQQEFGVTFPTLLDDSGKNYPVSNAFGIDTVPSLFLVEPDGKVSLSGAGFARGDLEAIGQRAGATPFVPGERVPDFRPG